ncbi:hypothetical protein B0F90DRAFT_1921990 [Multifurca ochricompacta]|uniref:Uncharacterized protein n=1 Tax=Multifurca ochricompacta TaxID=376703 RepID=A0AAD4QIE1_9AGAM|nr:hypothetical protein B0F90DRAFT_1921990 [Multifurca ochricompacta]
MPSPKTIGVGGQSVHHKCPHVPSGRQNLVSFWYVSLPSVFLGSSCSIKNRLTMAVMVKFWGARYISAQKVMQRGILEILKLARSILVRGACSKQPIVQSGERQVPKADAFFQQPFVQLRIVIPKWGRSERQFEMIGQLPGAATMPALVQSFGAGFEVFVRDNRNTSSGRLNLVITECAVQLMTS